MRMRLFFVTVAIMLSVGTFVSCGNKKKAEDTAAQTEKVEGKCCQGTKDEACADKTKECCQANPECETDHAEKRDSCQTEKSE